MHDLSHNVNHSWEQATKGEIPLVVAAFTTNAALAAFAKIEPQLVDLCSDLNPFTVQKAFSQTVPAAPISESHTADFSKDSSGVDVIEALRGPLQLLCSSKQGHKIVSRTTTNHLFQKPLELIPQHCPTASDADTESLTLLLQNLVRLANSRRSLNTITSHGSPLLADVSHFYTYEGQCATGLASAFGLRTLQESYRSYLWAPGALKPVTNCRLSVLRYADDAACATRAVLDNATMPCRCVGQPKPTPSDKPKFTVLAGTLAFHLEDLHCHLRKFAQERIFDLYFQSPWVASSHMLEALDAMFYYGLRLFSYRNYVGSVLHVYNILRCLTDFEPIPLLEELCEKFKGVVFSREKPVRNFKACYCIFIGGRLRFKKGRKTHDHRNSWHVAIPPHTAKAVAGFGLRKEANDSRFEYRKVSMFYHIKDRNYHLDNEVLDWVQDADSNEKRRVKRTKKPRYCCTERMGTEDSTLLSVQHAVLAEFSGELPIAKTNLFAVYLACVKIIEIITARGHDGDEKHCLCFCTAMLEAADRYRTNEHKMEPFGCPELLKTCKEAISSVLKDRPLSDFVWSF